ncbi:uncharacterized protein [Spinacia oleracea]|uniref:CASP-like protein n=1 Tax=Spinacia oleracea TaxID=3562 RepID=A0ABM3QK76_SPIOL|nr:uncharacterized protein LOC130460118 [Spinacia oleracea]
MRTTQHKEVNMGEPKIAEYLAVGFLGSAAAVLAFVAGTTRIKASNVSITTLGECKYPRSPAIILGYIAALLTLITQIAICVVFRLAYRRRNNTNTKSRSPFGAILCFILSWVGSGIGIGFLLSGAKLSGRQEFVVSTGHCYTLKHNLFKAGGFMALFACCQGLCTLYTFLAEIKYPPEAIPYQGGIALANSQLDAASANSNPKQQQQYV